MYDNGIYVGANFISTNILDYLNTLKTDIKKKLIDQVELLEPHYDPHITIIYSCDKPKGVIDEKALPEEIDISPYKLDVFPYSYEDVNGSCLVLKVKSNVATNLCDGIMKKHGLSLTHDKYRPHITLFLVNGMNVDDLKKIINNKLNFMKSTIKAQVVYSIEELTV